jgi:predicted RNA-binding protein associated with RNAse of E/G family
VALRYITTDRRIEMAWPCRVVRDTDELLALFIAAGSRYRGGPKRTAAQKATDPRLSVPPEEYVWRNDTLRLMFPGARHSVSLFWDTAGPARRLVKYFVNLEEPFRRTATGFDTQDHTLDVVVTPELTWQWRDEAELESHTTLGFYTPELAVAVRAEGQRVIDAIAAGEHPCVHDFREWRPDPGWSAPTLPASWSATPAASWELRRWAYGNAD